MELLTQKQADAIKKKIEDHRIEVGKLRDAIRESISELESLEDSCERASGSLDDAADALSELA